MDKESSVKIYGLIGYPVKHSLSPVMHNAAFKALKINAEYRLFEIKPEELEDFLLKNIKVNDIEGRPSFSQEIIGFNITIPHKVKALKIKRTYLTIPPNVKTVKYSLIRSLRVWQFPEVILCGAVNTVKREDHILHYFNTDVFGFIKSLKEDLRFNTRNKNVLLFGCGGAGRAVITGLNYKATKIKRIYIYDKSKKNLESTKKHFSDCGLLVKEIEFISTEQIPEKIKVSDLLVNASPVGMKEGDGSIIDKRLLHKGLSVYDVVYNRETELIKDARSLGLSAVGGLGMLLYQGAVAFWRWTNKKPPIRVMRKALEEAINKL